MQIPWTWIVLVLVVVGLIVLKQRGQVPGDDARRLLAEGAVVIDVRSKAEFSSGHIEGAINLPLEVVAEKIATVAPDPDAPVFLHCMSGTRSAMAARKLRALGYKQVFNLGSLARAGKLCEEARGK
ncbi:MAG: rhodanese-like domain-containing protein [Akkermansiaceae bacterium]|nr:rhodanese-like domain-containing protein [Akkermansiaceae bacterium]